VVSCSHDITAAEAKCNDALGGAADPIVDATKTRNMYSPPCGCACSSRGTGPEPAPRKRNKGRVSIHVSSRRRNVFFAARQVESSIAQLPRESPDRPEHLIQSDAKCGAKCGAEIRAVCQTPVFQGFMAEFGKPPANPNWDR